MGTVNRNNPQSFEEMAADDAKEVVKETTEVVNETTEDVVTTEPQENEPAE